jgi:8-oxo-dGTP pyrophosphatase MutT (NUDIX family)
MKNLTVIIPFYIEFKNNMKKVFILLGKQALGRKMPGIRNGFGGKCEQGESFLDCAIRELKEESKIDASEKSLIEVGSIFENEKQIKFYIIKMFEKVEIEDNGEVVDVRWFDIQKPEIFVNEMLSQDEVLIQELSKYFFDNENYINFKIDKTGDVKLLSQTKNIFS